MIAATPGLTFAEPYPIGLLFAGVAVFAAVGALSHQHDRAFSASLIYLGLGVLAAVVMQVLDLPRLEPVEKSSLFEKAAELAVIVALFGTGLKLERELKAAAWQHVGRLLLVAMPLTIGLVALFGSQMMGLSLGAAIVLAATLAPTDPVLAGDVGVGPPGDEEEREPNFSITGEAGLNDGLAYPFVLLGIILAGSEADGWLADWLLADVAYRVVVAVIVGGALGYGIAALAVWLRDRDLLAPELDGWLAIAAVLVIYGATELVSAYGFLAAFVGGVAFRRYEHGHEYNRSVHDGAETVEKFGELALILLLGSSLTLDGLQAPGWSGWLLAPALLLVARPVSVLIALVGSSMTARERLFVAWFGVRGIGSLYYAAVAVGAGVLSGGEAAVVLWTTVVCIVVSIVAHGVSATGLSRRWLGH
ncbi:cation:proton antiporter [Solirubrobacter sp. CPCC 204708]|uniref:Cation:proton antiporter n=1 Tax=Solirubrobacter deserti TaxID=2282478 RepID=A0ABT4RJU1_9ACTN|nr:cation:proton antiporter [Solirubrobacter deserti]MBE2315878.1 cation:proton antiporter [Solirubrobacter deserti]MDA0138782.1 cation:proton antiporter [Solirubrobacter deserti]